MQKSAYVKLIMVLKQNFKMESEYRGNPPFPVQGHVVTEDGLMQRAVEVNWH